MEPMNPTFVIRSNAGKPPRWKRAAYVVVHYAAMIAVGLWVGVCTHMALDWLFAPL